MFSSGDMLPTLPTQSLLCMQPQPRPQSALPPTLQSSPKGSNLSLALFLHGHRGRGRGPVTLTAVERWLCTVGRLVPGLPLMTDAELCGCTPPKSAHYTCTDTHQPCTHQTTISPSRMQRLCTTCG